MLVWNRGSQDNEIISGCGQYKICRIRRDKWVFFSAEKRVSELCWVSLKMFETSDEAKKHCVDDLGQEQIL